MPNELELGIQESLKFMQVLKRIPISEPKGRSQFPTFTVRLPSDIAKQLRELPGVQADHIERALRLYVAVMTVED